MMSKSKIIPINKKALNDHKNSNVYDFKGVVKNFGDYSRDPNQQHKVFTELRFSYHEDDEICFACDRNGSCPDHSGKSNLYKNGRLYLDESSKLKKIVIYVDVLEIASAMENQSNEIESFYFLDIETGNVEYYDSEIYHIFKANCSSEIETLPEWQQEALSAVKKVENAPEQFKPIPKIESSDVFKFMEEFTFEVQNKNLTALLQSALGQNRPFRRFKDILSDNPDVENEWYLFKNKKLAREVQYFIETINHDHVELRMPHDKK